MSIARTLLQAAGASLAPSRFRDSVVVIVDAQREYLDGALPLPGAGPALHVIAGLLHRARVADTPGRCVLVVLTDGEDTTSSTNLSQLLNLVKASRVTIYPVAFAGSYSVGTSKAMSARAVLNQLAELSGGSVYAPGASRDLAAVYASIISELKAQYVLGYVPENAKPDGKFRRLKD